MRVALLFASLFAIALSTPVHAEDLGSAHQEGGIDIDNSSAIKLKNGKETIKMVQTRTIGVVKYDDNANQAVNLRQEADIPASQATSIVSSIDGRLPAQLTDDFKTGVRLDLGDGQPPVQGLATSNSDPNTGAVKDLTIPTNPPTTITDPHTPDGKPVTPQMLGQLGQGKRGSLTILDANGKAYNFGQPQGGPVSG